MGRRKAEDVKRRAQPRNKRCERRTRIFYLERCLPLPEKDAYRWGERGLST
jgi:hypothetical protein